MTSIENIIIRKSEASSRQFVFADGKLVGYVRKVQDWTVRGKPTRWEATKKGGRYLGSGSTRKEAVGFLL